MDDSVAQPKSDGRGRVTNAEEVRAMRNREYFERYDSVFVYSGAQAKSKGFFDTFAQFANSTRVTWFASRDANIDLAYSNSRTERLDQAQDIYNVNACFYAETHQAQFTDLSPQNQVAVTWWTQELPKYMAFQMLLGDADILAQGTGDRFMAGSGNTGGYAQDTGAAYVNGGNNGAPEKSNGYFFPEPIMLAAQAQLSIIGQIATPFKDALAALPGPGFVEVPNGLGGYIVKPIQYGIKFILRGPRYLQLRGAYTSH